MRPRANPSFGRGGVDVRKTLVQNGASAPQRRRNQVMHGIVFAELQKFVVSEHGHPGWKAVADKAGMAHKVYLSAGQYPDSEITSLVTAAWAINGQEPFQLVEAFGEFIVPSLLTVYGHLLKPHAKSLDVIEHTEGTVQTVGRENPKHAFPPM